MEAATKRKQRKHREKALLEFLIESISKVRVNFDYSAKEEGEMTIYAGETLSVLGTFNFNAIGTATAIEPASGEHEIVSPHLISLYSGSSIASPKKNSPTSQSLNLNSSTGGGSGGGNGGNGGGYNKRFSFSLFKNRSSINVASPNHPVNEPLSAQKKRFSIMKPKPATSPQAGNSSTPTPQAFQGPPISFWYYGKREGSSEEGYFPGNYCSEVFFGNEFSFDIGEESQDKIVRTSFCCKPFLAIIPTKKKQCKPKDNPGKNSEFIACRRKIRGGGGWEGLFQSIDDQNEHNKQTNKQLEDLYYDFKCRVDLKRKKINGYVFDGCFSASEAIDLLILKMGLSTREQGKHIYIFLCFTRSPKEFEVTKTKALF